MTEPSTCSSASSLSRPAPLFASDDAAPSSGTTYVSPQAGYSLNTSAASLRFKSTWKSDSDRLDDFKRSVAAAARARGVSEKRILREMDDDDEEEGADLPDPETAFERMIPLSKKVKREETPAEESFAARAFERLATPQPAYKSTSWKPPRQDPAKRAPLSDSRKAPVSTGDVLDLADQDDSSDDELMKALDAAMEATSPLALRVGRRRERDDRVGEIDQGQAKTPEESGRLSASA